MKSIDVAIEEHENAYLWEDGTIDLTIEIEQSFEADLKECHCIVCESTVMTGNETLLAAIGDGTLGMDVNCGNCNAHYFIHGYVPTGAQDSDLKPNDWSEIFSGRS
jgi:hypothetical protein